MDKEGSYYIETIRVGNYLKVTACDPQTGEEASVVGPLNAAKRDLANLAIKKLQLLKNREN
jgi:hypothetical protein